MRKPTEIEPLGTGELMPAILVGFVRPDSTPKWQSLTRDSPRYIVGVLQQAGGYSMSYPEATGILMRFAGNEAFAHRESEPRRLVQGFRLMAEDPEFGVLEKEYPKLRKLCGTWGDDYSESQLNLLRTSIQPYFRIPPPVGGLEAFVELESCDLMTYFADWRCVVISNGVERIEGIQQRRRGELWSDGPGLTQQMLDEVCELGKEVGISQPLRSVLLWENSD